MSSEAGRPWRDIRQPPIDELPAGLSFYHQIERMGRPAPPSIAGEIAMRVTMTCLLPAFWPIWAFAGWGSFNQRCRDAAAREQEAKYRG